MSTDEIFHIQLLNVKDRIYEAQRQVHVLVAQKTDMEVLYERALTESQIDFSRTLKLRITKLEGLISAFQEYLEQQVQEMMLLMAYRTHQLRLMDHHSAFDLVDSDDRGMDTDSSFDKSLSDFDLSD